MFRVQDILGVGILHDFVPENNTEYLQREEVQ